MRVIVICLIIFKCMVFSIEDAIGKYILNDTTNKISIKSRLTYGDKDSTKWQYFSSFNTKLSFPKVKTFFNLSPIFEFGHYTNHMQDASQSKTRLSQSYIDLNNGFGRFSIGEKRLSFESGRFVSDSTFALLPRTFNQLSYASSNNQFQLYYLFSVSLPMSTDRHFFNRGSYIAALNDIYLTRNLSFNFHSYFFEDYNNTYSISAQFTPLFNQTITSTLAYQTDPSIVSAPVSKKSSFFHDIIYENKYNDRSFEIGTRFFQGGNNSQNGFQAPFSSGYSWDGILNIYQPDIKTGFQTHYRSIFGSIQTPLSPSRKLSLDWFLFRDHLLEKNYGAEIDIIIKDSILKDSVFWFYKVGQFIPGTHSSSPSEIKMWLDFVILIDD